VKCIPRSEGDKMMVGDAQGQDAGSLTSPLLNAKQAAKYLSISRALFYRMVSSGRAPGPVRLGGAVRWLKQELDEWLAAGAPPRTRWETLKAEGRRRRGKRPSR
jgi:excisionase family DNA binding protein